MSRRYALVDLILKETVCPWSTLISVAKPWTLLSPAPAMSHSEEGLPGCWFSHATGLDPDGGGTHVTPCCRPSIVGPVANVSASARALAKTPARRGRTRRNLTVERRRTRE